MGCNASTNATDKGLGSDIDRYLTSEEKKMIKDSWAIVSLDLAATGLHIFTRLFEMEKDMKKLFRRLMSTNETGEFVFDSVRLEHHATMLMNNIGQAVAKLDESAMLGEVLRQLGERHIAYNVKHEMLPFLWPAIRDGLKMRLGDKFTTETELAWKHLFDFITQQMTIGMTQGNQGKSQSKSIKAKAK